MLSICREWWGLDSRVPFESRNEVGVNGVKKERVEMALQLSFRRKGGASAKTSPQFWTGSDLH